MQRNVELLWYFIAWQGTYLKRQDFCLFPEALAYMLSMCQDNSLQTAGRVQSLVVLPTDESAEEKFL